MLQGDKRSFGGEELPLHPSGLLEKEIGLLSLDLKWNYIKKTLVFTRDQRRRLNIEQGCLSQQRAFKGELQSSLEK